jgi:prevent-host-death family protein
MRSWQVQEAKSRLSALLDLARTEGPQEITRHSEATAVVVSAAEYKRLTQRDREPLVDFLQRLGREGLGEIVIERDRNDLGREIDLPRAERRRRAVEGQPPSSMIAAVPRRRSLREPCSG